MASLRRFLICLFSLHGSHRCFGWVGEPKSMLIIYQMLVCIYYICFFIEEGTTFQIRELLSLKLPFSSSSFSSSSPPTALSPPRLVQSQTHPTSNQNPCTNTFGIEEGFSLQSLVFYQPFSHSVDSMSYTQAFHSLKDAQQSNRQMAS